jgi:cytoskeleton protein RodZ
VVDNEDTATALFPERVGDRLRAARMTAGLDLSDVATKTRVPLRHLQAIEGGDYAALPGSTYCVGFVRSYARVVGVDEVEAASDLRVELGALKLDQRADRIEYQVADATRLPGKTLAWTAAAVALLIAVGFGFWRNNMVADPDPVSEIAVASSDSATVEAAGEDDLTPQTTTVSPASTAAMPSATSEVVLTATSPVWMRVYDAADKVLFEKEMTTGERFVVPADANNPQVRTGRADLISVTVNGQAVAALGPGQRTIKNVGISAAALTARTAPPAANTSPIEANPSAPAAVMPVRP